MRITHGAHSPAAAAPIKRIDARLLPSQLQHGLQVHNFNITGQRLLPAVCCATDGAAGYGEAPPLASFTGESADDTLRQLREFAPDLLGAAPGDALDRIHAPGNGLGTPARAAFDIALHDLIGTTNGVPLHALLSEDAATTVRISRAIGFHDLDQTVDLARAYSSRGITALKLKVGRDTALDATVIKAVREAIGPNLELTIDANEAFTANEAVALVEACGDVGLAYFEQPVRRDDFVGLKQVRATGVRVLVDESLFGQEDAYRLIDSAAADLFAIKLIKCGGLRPAMAVARIAREHDIPVVVIDPLGSAVSLNAGLHLAAVLPDMGFAHGLSAGLDVSAPHAEHLPIENGVITLPSRPGLGAQVDWPKSEPTRSAIERSKT